MSMYDDLVNGKEEYKRITRVILEKTGNLYYRGQYSYTELRLLDENGNIILNNATRTDVINFFRKYPQIEDIYDNVWSKKPIKKSEFTIQG